LRSAETAATEVPEDVEPAVVGERESVDLIGETAAAIVSEAGEVVESGVVGEGGSGELIGETAAAIVSEAGEVVGSAVEGEAVETSEGGSEDLIGEIAGGDMIGTTSAEIVTGVRDSDGGMAETIANESIDSHDVLITSVDTTEQQEMTNEEPEEYVEDDDEIPSIRLPRFSEEEMRPVLEKLVKSKQLPPNEMVPSILDYARRQNVLALMAEDYDQAARIDTAIDVILQHIRRAGIESECERMAMTLQQRLEEAIVQRRQIQEDYAQRIADFKVRQEQRMESLKQQHESERQGFERQWSRPGAILTFSKPSSSLLQVRQIQKSLAISHRFDQAKELKREGDQMQRVESAVAGGRATDAMKIAYAQLLEKEEKELLCLQQNGERKLAVLEDDRDRKLSANHNLKAQLEAKKVRPMQPQRPVVTVPQVGAKRPARPRVSGIISVRTMVKYVAYKKANQLEKLEVTIGDVSAITKAMTPAGKMRNPTSKGARRGSS
jgi:hypothetical protein